MCWFGAYGDRENLGIEELDHLIGASFLYRMIFTGNFYNGASSSGSI